MIRRLVFALALVASVSVVSCRVTVHEDPPPRHTEVVYVHEAHPDYRPATTEVVVVQTAPPPPRKEVIIESSRPTPNHVWIGGYWRWDGHTHVWMAGGWHPRPHSGATWVDGHWERRGNGHVWVAGHWR